MGMPRTNMKTVIPRVNLTRCGLSTSGQLSTRPLQNQGYQNILYKTSAFMEGVHYNVQTCVISCFLTVQKSCHVPVMRDSTPQNCESMPRVSSMMKKRKAHSGDGAICSTTWEQGIKVGGWEVQSVHQILSFFLKKLHNPITLWADDWMIWWIDELIARI